MSAANVPRGLSLPKDSRLKKAQAFQARQYADWKHNFRTLMLTPPQTGAPFNPEWLLKLPVGAKSYMGTKSDEIRSRLNFYYPYTHVLKGDENYGIRKNYVDEQGIARAYDDQSATLGKVHLGPEFWDYANESYNRKLAQEFDQFVMNNMDISTLLKKQYWKKVLPGYYDKLIQGCENQMKKDFRASQIFLKGPQNEEDWEFLYNYIMYQQYSVEGTELTGSVPTPILPPDWDMDREDAPRDPPPGDVSSSPVVAPPKKSPYAPVKPEVIYISD